MTHSAYIADPDGYGLEVLYNLPEEVWGGDVDAALNYFEYLPARPGPRGHDRLPALRRGRARAGRGARPGEGPPGPLTDALSRSVRVGSIVARRRIGGLERAGALQVKWRAMVPRRPKSAWNVSPARAGTARVNEPARITWPGSRAMP